jgi:GAF domain-containing protein
MSQQIQAEESQLSKPTEHSKKRYAWIWGGISFIILTIIGGIITDKEHYLWDWIPSFMHWQYFGISVALSIIVILLGSLIATLIWKKGSLDQCHQALTQEQSDHQQLKQKAVQEQSDHQQLKDECKAINIILNRLETFNSQEDSSDLNSDIKKLCDNVLEDILEEIFERKVNRLALFLPDAQQQYLEFCSLSGKRFDRLPKFYIGPQPDLIAKSGGSLGRAWRTQTPLYGKIKDENGKRIYATDSSYIELHSGRENPHYASYAHVPILADPSSSGSHGSHCLGVLVVNSKLSDTFDDEIIKKRLCTVSISLASLLTISHNLSKSIHFQQKSILQPPASLP